MTVRLWGTRSQVGATVRELADARGNADGVWNDERRAPGDLSSASAANPLLSKLARFFEVGLSAADEIARLRGFVADAEARYGQPITTLAAGELRNFELFRAQKAIALQRLERTPSELRDFFVSAEGSVRGREIPARRIFCQHLTPSGTPTGRVVVVSPGFQETGRNFYEQAAALSRAGHHVVLMDHQWAGYSDGKRGGLDSGFGMARDVAAVCAEAARLGEVTLLGNSMGGAAALIATTANDAGWIELAGRAMPAAVPAVLQAPYLAATPSLTNTLLRAASHIPVLNRIATPSLGVPVLTREPVAAQKTAQGAVLEDARARLSAMTAADFDVVTTLEALINGEGRGRLVVLHGVDDPLASIEGSRHLMRYAGSRSELIELPTSAHVIEQSPTYQGLAVEAVGRLATG